MTRKKVNILSDLYAVFVFCSKILSKYPSVNLLQEPRKEGKEENGVWQILRSFRSFDYVNGFIVYHDLVSSGLFYYAPSFSYRVSHFEIYFFFQNTKQKHFSPQIIEFKNQDDSEVLNSDFSGLKNHCTLIDLSGLCNLIGLNSLYSLIFSKNFLIPMV